MHNGSELRGTPEASVPVLLLRRQSREPSPDRVHCSDDDWMNQRQVDEPQKPVCHRGMILDEVGKERLEPRFRAERTRQFASKEVSPRLPQAVAVCLG